MSTDKPSRASGRSRTAQPAESTTPLSTGPTDPATQVAGEDLGQRIGATDLGAPSAATTGDIEILASGIGTSEPAGTTYERDRGSYASASTSGAYGAGTTGGESTSAGASSHSVADTARSAASGIAAQVKQRATTQVSVQKDRAADQLGNVARAIRQAGDHIRGGNAGIASYIDMASDELQQLATRLRDKDPHEFVTDLEDFARRRPAVFIGGAFVLGLGLARFLKSSGARQYRAGRMGTGTTPAPGYASTGSQYQSNPLGTRYGAGQDVSTPAGMP